MNYNPTDLIEVFYKNDSVGALALDPNSGYYAFEYSPEFTKKGIELAPLAVPTSTAEPVVFSYLPESTYYRLPAFIADSLPDKFGNSLIDVWMARNGIQKKDISILDRLAYIGKRGMGALEFKPMIRLGDRKPSALEMNELISTARQAVEVNIQDDIPGASDPAIKQLISVGTSAGGARAKAVVGYNSSSKKFVSGQFDLPKGFDHWLIKFDLPEQEGKENEREYGRVEYAYFLMAKECGINMSDSILYELDGRGHFMTKRFDRQGNHKIHMQTLCAMSELDYNQIGTHDYIQLFQTVKDLNLGYESIDQVFLRMVFNVILMNNDDHSKNFSFLMEDNIWSLSPAYDLTFSMDPDNKWLRQHLMGVDGKFDNITDDDLISVGRRFHVSNPDKIIKTVRDVAYNWIDFGKQAGLSEPEIKRISKYIS